MLIARSIVSRGTIFTGSSLYAAIGSRSDDEHIGRDED